MFKCTRCGDRNSEDYVEIPNHGVFCGKCMDSMAQEGLAQARQDALELGDSVVTARFEELRKNLEGSLTVH